MEGTVIRDFVAEYTKLQCIWIHEKAPVNTVESFET